MVQLGGHILRGFVVWSRIDHGLVRLWEQQHPPLVLGEERKTWAVFVETASPGLKFHLTSTPGLLRSRLVQDDGDLLAAHRALVGVPKYGIVFHHLPTGCMQSTGTMPDVLDGSPTSGGSTHNL